MDDLTPQEMLIDMLNDEYSLTGLKAPVEAKSWTEAQIQRFFDTNGKCKPNVAQAQQATAIEAEEKKAKNEAAMQDEVRRGTPFGVLGIPRTATEAEVPTPF